LLEGLESWRIRGVFVDCDDPWGGRMRGPEGLAEEALSGLSITRLAKQKVDSLAGGIDSSVEIIPAFFDLDVGLIDAI